MNRFINLKFASLLFLLLIPVIALSDLFDNKPTEEPEKIQWLADRPLTWADFKGDKDSIIYGQEEA